MPKKNNGKPFEAAIKESCQKDNILFERYIDSNKFGFQDGGAHRFTPENPCDCHMYNGNSLFYMELKSTVGTGISFNNPVLIQPKGKAKPSIKTNQIKNLVERSKYKNTYCGLLLDYANRELKSGTKFGGTYYIDVNDFVNWTKSVDKKSINKDEASAIGVEVNRHIKKVNYNYDVRELLNKIMIKGDKHEK